MTTKKTSALNPDLLATKGTARPVSAKDMPQRGAEGVEGPNTEPLNFKVSAEFRRRFKMYAAEHGLKGSEVLRKAFDLLENRANVVP